MSSRKRPWYVRLRRIFLWLSQLTPKNKTIIFFEGEPHLNGNAVALFNHMHASEKAKVLWFYKDANSPYCRHLQVSADHFIHHYSWKAFRAALTAKVFVITDGLGDLDFYKYFSQRTKLVNLWHGVALKRYEALNASLSEAQANKIAIRNRKAYSLVISASDFDQYVVASCMGVDARKVKVTGYPRSDLFFTSDMKARHQAVINQFDAQDKKIILYAPTFRDGKDVDYFPFKDFSVNALEAFLRAHNALILVRPHPNDVNAVGQIQNKTENKNENQAGNNGASIVMADFKTCPDVQALLAVSHVVLTDYSSIFIEGLSSETMPIFIPYDLHQYEGSRGVIYPYEVMTPGPKVTSQAALMDSIEDALAGARQYADQRALCKIMFSDKNDGQACQRVETELLDLLNA